MNLNIIAYISYFTLTAIIILYVGRVCYTNGDVFIKNLLPNNIVLANQVNKVLLIGYYLLNIGYCAITIISWDRIDSTLKLIEIVSYKVSFIVLLIGIVHYFNIYILKNYIHKL